MDTVGFALLNIINDVDFSDLGMKGIRNCSMHRDSGTICIEYDGSLSVKEGSSEFAESIKKSIESYIRDVWSEHASVKWEYDLAVNKKLNLIVTESEFWNNEVVGSMSITWNNYSPDNDSFEFTIQLDDSIVDVLGENI